MSVTPTSIVRVPNALMSRTALGNISRTSMSLLNVQSQIATGRQIQRVSDDVVRATLVGVLDDQLERSLQIRRNLTHAGAALGVLDSSLDEAGQLVAQARDIASDQGQLTASPTERAGQAIVVDQIVRGLLSVANRQGVAGYAFGGSVTSRMPFVEHLGGIRYVGEGPGLVTDLGHAARIPVTLGAGNPIAAVSSRVRGSVDLDPALAANARLSDLAGARGLGVSLGTIEFSFDGGPRATINLAGSDTVQDVLTRIDAALRQYETDNTVTILGPGGVSTSGGGISIDVVGGTPNPALSFFEVGTGGTARDLGLTADTPFAFDNAAPFGGDVAPRLTWQARIDSLQGLTGTLGQLRISNAGRSVAVDLSTAVTLEDVRNAIEGTNLGVRVAINAAGTGIDVINDLSTASSQALSIEEVSGQNFTATRLGIRSFGNDTRLSDFNFGRGVEVIDGRTNPISGAIDPTLNTDLRIILGDAGATALDIDLRPQDMTTVSALLTRVNSEIAAGLAAAGLPAGSLVAGLSDGGNGIRLTQSTGFTGPIRVEALNNSTAAESLGLLGGTYDASSATFAGTDRAKVRVDSVFTQLMDLRESLLGNSTFGIGLAGESLESSIGSLAETRGLVGGFAQRVESASVREDGQSNFGEQVRSELRDVDFTEAASRFSLLQTQLQAALQTTGSLQRLTLLDFIG
ncbi:MAG: hypothetical protein HUU18_10765 [Phycisphaerales bacterium]|nr:hypothetical protein [Phycisphaerales bacterium]